MIIMKKASNVDSYIKATPKEVRAKLLQLRSIIKAAAPKAEERISYGMPYYGYHGRLAYFRPAKTHIGLYIPTPTLEKYKKELKGYSTSKATVRFPLDRKLPATLIRKLIKSRMKWNEENA
jgi:uncharacterized protein YdhG (YjbR/CyaY superfamily)